MPTINTKSLHDSAQDAVNPAVRTLVTQASESEPQPIHKNTNGRWSMYVQATGEEGDNGLVVGHLVMVSPDGAEKKEYSFSSGPYGKGALPGLINDHNLDNVSYISGNPITEYNVGSMENRYERGYETADGKAGFVIRLSNPNLDGRDDFLIHPNTNDVGTHGCVGLGDKDGSAKRFEDDWKQLVQNGQQPTKLEVYSPTQDIAQLKARAPDVQKALAEHVEQATYNSKREVVSQQSLPSHNRHSYMARE